MRDLLGFIAAADRGSTVSADPALRPLLAAEQARLERLVRGEELVGGLPRALRSLKKRLYPYQVDGVKRILGRGRLLLADDMGLGKTAQAIAACHLLWKTGQVKRGLLIVPASLKPQWLREWRLFSDAPVEIVEGTATERAEQLAPGRRGFLIVNYEQVLRDLLVMHAWRPDVVVLDEAQRIKNWATKTATYVKRLQAPYRLVLTGTPMENRLEELASIMDWVDDQALEPKWRLEPWHAMAADGEAEVAGARNLHTLRARLAGGMVRRLRSDVLDQLPPRTDTRVPVMLTQEQAEEHHALDQPIAALVARARRRPLTQAEFLRLMSLLTTQRIICNGLAQLRFEEVWPQLCVTRQPSEASLKSVFSPKLLELRELVRNLVVTQRRKVVVFSQWRRMLRLASWAVSDLLEEAGGRALFFTGEEGLKRRTQNLLDFHDDPKALVLFASDAGGVGLNLQRAASCCINLEIPWNPAVLEQRIGRIYRLGQASPIEVYHLVSEGGIESRIAELLGDKRAFFTGLFDGDSDEIRFDHSGSFLSRIEKLVETIEAPELAIAADDDADDGAAVADDVSAVISADEEAALADSPPSPALRGGGNGQSALAASPVAPAAARVTFGGIEVGDLLSRISIHPATDGGVTIEAPREAAAAMAAILEGLARKLGAWATPA